MSRDYTNICKERFCPPIEELHIIAKKYSRQPDEAEDLVQDLLFETIRTDRDISDEQFMPWAHGFLRNRAAFIARSEGRRRNREKKVTENGNLQSIKRLQFPSFFIDGLTPALRQRFSSLRKEWNRHLKKAKGTGPEIKDEPESPLNIGLLRRSLQQSFQSDSVKTVGSFDPDGNLLIFRTKSAHKKEPGGNNRVKK